MRTCMCAAMVGFVLSVGSVIAAEQRESLQDFTKKDRQALEEFRAGQKTGADQTKTKPKISTARAEVSPERARAQALYDRYCQLRNTLENGDPRRGYNKRISDLENRLYPTGRAYADWLQWSADDNFRNYPFLQELIVRRRAIQTEMETLARQWGAAGLSTRMQSLDDCYGRKTWSLWSDRNFPPPNTRSNEVDYVGFHLERIWPTNAIPTDANGVYEHKPPAPPEPPSAPEMDESTNNVPAKESWDEMTPDEKHLSLKANDADAWRAIYDALISGVTETNLIEEVKNALNATGASATPPAISFTNLTPTTVTPAKLWKDMTPQERHVALRRNENPAWDAVREALLSGDPNQVAVVIEALGDRTLLPCACPACKPQGSLECSQCVACLYLLSPPGTGDAKSGGLRNHLLSGNTGLIAAAVAEVLRAESLPKTMVGRFAYANGYLLGRSEKQGGAKQSMLDATAAAYQREDDRNAVRNGYADAVAGKSPQPPEAPAK